MGRVCTKGFFELQLSFAERVRGLSGVPLEVALFESTNLYVRLGLGRNFDVANPGWQAYLAGLREAGDVRSWTYQFYMRDAETRTAPAVEATFGCFSYALPGGDHVRLHFQSAADGDRSSLQVEQRGRRRAELRALFEDLKPRVDPDIPVVGASWLYNLEAYRRLFPPDYVASARPIGRGLRSMALWGQFLDRFGQVRPVLAASFLKAVAETSDPANLSGCFPLQALTVRAPVRYFYDFYGVEPCLSK